MATNIEFASPPGCDLIRLTSGPFEIGGGDVSIDGPGASALTISGSGTSVAFYIGHASVTISGLTITDGDATSASVYEGGGITNQDGTVSVQNCIISEEQWLQRKI